MANIEIVPVGKQPPSAESDWTVVSEAPLDTKAESQKWEVAKTDSKPAAPKNETWQDEIASVFSTINEKGIAGTLGLPVDAVNAAIKPVLESMGIEPSKKPFLGSDMLRDSMRGLGMSSETAKPETTAGHIAADMGSGIATAVLGGGGLGGAVRGVGEAMLSPAMKAAGTAIASPSANVATAIGGGVGGAAGEQSFKDTPLQGAAKIIGELGGGVAGGLAMGTRLRPAPVADPVVAAYERLNLAPSAAESGIGGRAAQWLQGNVLPQTLGGGGVMERFKQKRLQEITNLQEHISSAFGASKPRAEMGKSVQDSVMDNWQQAKTKAGEVIGEIKDKYANDVVYPGKFVAAVTNPLGAGTTKGVRDTTLDPLVVEAQKVIRESGGQFTLADLAALKAKYGYALEPGYQKNTNDAQVSQLFTALKQDIEAHVRARSPEDFARLQKANSAYHDAQETFKQNFKKLLGSNNVPVSSERAYEILVGAATEKGRGDLKEFKVVWDALPAGERGNLAATIINRLGSTDKSALASPENFSLGKFISEYKNVSQEAKDLLFKSTGNQAVRRELDDLVTVANNIQEKLAKLASSSRSGTGVVMLGQAGLIGGNLFSGNIPGLFASLVGPYVAAQTLTNPTAVKALAKSLRGVEATVDATVRSVIDLEAIPAIISKPPERASQ